MNIRNLPQGPTPFFKGSALYYVGGYGGKYPHWHNPSGSMGMGQWYMRMIRSEW